MRDLIRRLLRRLSVALSVTLVLAGTASGADGNRAWKPYNETEAQVAMVSLSPREVDHLLPYLPGLPGPYGSIESELISCLASYRYDPAFEASQQWCLNTEGERYVIKIWRYQEENDFQSNAYRLVSTAEVSEDVAYLIQSIWVNALIQTRYPGYNSLGLDGETHYFGARVSTTLLMLYGTTWSPQADLPPRWMTDVGLKVLDSVVAESFNQKDLLKYLNEQQKRFFSYYRKFGLVH